MASLPSVPMKQSLEKHKDSLLAAAGRGETPEMLAKKLWPENTKTNRVKRRRFVRQAYELFATDVELQGAVGLRAKGQLIFHLPKIVEALTRRAIKSGRPDAIKLAMEASGFHTPRQQHEHSGQIEIKVSSMPRPKPVEEDIPDVDVVDEAGPA